LHRLTKLFEFGLGLGSPRILSSLLLRSGITSDAQQDNQQRSRGTFFHCYGLRKARDD
jgi:hypothetical protein